MKLEGLEFRLPVLDRKLRQRVVDIVTYLYRLEVIGGDHGETNGTESWNASF
jgi:hypothetical protein